MKCHAKQKFGIKKIASYGQVLGLRASNKIDHNSCDIHKNVWLPLVMMFCQALCIIGFHEMYFHHCWMKQSHASRHEKFWLFFASQGELLDLLWWDRYPFIIAISITFDVAKGAINDVLTLLWCQILLLVPSGCQRVRGNWGSGAIFPAEGSLFYEKRCTKKQSQVRLPSIYHIYKSYVFKHRDYSVSKHLVSENCLNRRGC